jgi:hypothetical protein
VGSSPAVTPHGPNEWSSKGLLHLEDGPGKVRADGSKEWFKTKANGREQRTVIERADGSKEWFNEGQSDSARPTPTKSNTRMCCK